MKTSSNQIVQIIRSSLIWLTVGALNVVSDIAYADLEHAIGWRDHLRWWSEGKLERLFNWAWVGSDEEIASVANGEVPVEYMSERQRVIYFFVANGAIQN